MGEEPSRRENKKLSGEVSLVLLGTTNGPYDESGGQRVT